jgi:D-tyrosyl-tRNA(Tyr) deacylase
MAQKISKLRVFEDEQGKMNLDLEKVNGEVLSVPQFTLLAKTEKGNRPGFDLAAAPAEAETLWKQFNNALRSRGISVREGEFGASMEVSLVNDGPVTFVFDSGSR